MKNIEWKVEWNKTEKALFVTFNGHAIFRVLPEVLMVTVNDVLVKLNEGVR